MDEQQQPPQVLSKNPAYGWSPISRRYVKRAGAVWKRLVMSGVVADEEVNAQLVGPPRPARQQNNVVIPDTVEPTHDESRAVGKETAAARKAAKRLIAQHVDDLEGLPPDQVEEILRRLLATKLGAPEPAARESREAREAREARAAAAKLPPPPQAAPAPSRARESASTATATASATTPIRVKIAAGPAKSRRVKVRELFSTTDDTGADSDDE